MAGDEGNAIDLLLDAGAAPLQYFRVMLDLAKVVSRRTWPDWRDHVCRSYDNERGIDLTAIRGDAALIRAQATTARQSGTEQAAARGQVQTAWPDAAGAAAVATLDAHQQRSEPVAAALEATAKAAEAVAGAVTTAVAAKVRRLSEFSQSSVPYADALLLQSVPGVLAGGGRISTELVAEFEQQLSRDLTQFDAIVADTVAAVRAAYGAVPAAAATDATPFPAPSFAQITVVATTPPPAAATAGTTTTGATTAGTTTGGSGGGGRVGGSTSGVPTGGSTGGSTGGGSTAARSAVPAGGATGASPSGSIPAGATPEASAPAGTRPTGGMPGAGTGGATPASTNPTGGTNPGSALSGLGNQAGAMPSWLQQLLPRLAEQLGLGKSDGKSDVDGKSAKPGDVKPGDTKPGDDKAGDKPGDKAGEKPAALTDAAGRKVTATLSPDGKTVEVTLTKPDGTEQRVTLRVGEDGKLTCVDGAPGAGHAAEVPAKGATPSAQSPAPAVPAEKPLPAAPAEKPLPAPSPTATPVPTPTPVPAPSQKAGGAKQATPSEPCPPDQQGSGAQFAITVP